ncbi:hypothetical protein TNCV_242991 [Trichonephila clavipes]|uniref:Reverse transcriptase/retrotransposon-derived protein RNase H-like domain-containing protein n=1 Tax=Trichonephila clavipes TaxID=2585209 RepID=A0A8X6W471_TRICX|nr:hypothetical protein TNCV_242991 [Trichonephila clavipes]
MKREKNGSSQHYLRYTLFRMKTRGLSPSKWAITKDFMTPQNLIYEWRIVGKKLTQDKGCEKVFVEFKGNLVSKPILFAPDFSKDFILQTDASDIGAGVVLSQKINDLCASSWIDENDYLGEYVLVKSKLDDVCHRLPLAKVKFKTKGGEFYTKAAVKVNSHPSEPYLLSNRTAELIQPREKSVLLIDAMVTRNASKIVPFEKERKAGLNAASGFSIENADPVFPTQGDGTEPTIEFPAFVERNEGETALLKNSDFSSEQIKCKDQHVLGERAKWGVSECCRTKEGNLESCWDEERGGIPKTRCALKIHP